MVKSREEFMRVAGEERRKEIAKLRILKSKESIIKVKHRLSSIKVALLNEHIDCLLKISNLKQEYESLLGEDISNTSHWYQDALETRKAEVKRGIILLKDTIEINGVIWYHQNTKHNNIIECLKQNIVKNKALLDQDFIKITVKIERE